MSESLRPEILFDLIEAHVPADLKKNILIVGSIAAAYHYRDSLISGGVRTKDADVMIQPAGAIAECRQIALLLLEAGWRKTDKCYPREQETHPELRAIRLYPPTSKAYFIELLAFPSDSQQERQTWIPVRLTDGWYGLPSFRFLGLARHNPMLSSNGLQYAAPAMMALSNLLSHPTIGTARMSDPIGGRALLRSAKDLGRVLALARLATRDEMDAWASEWAAALKLMFPHECAALASNVGAGMAALINDATVLDEARHAVDVGLLSGYQVTIEQLVAVGRQVQVDAIAPLPDALERLG